MKQTGLEIKQDILESLKDVQRSLSLIIEDVRYPDQSKVALRRYRSDIILIISRIRGLKFKPYSEYKLNTMRRNGFVIKQ